MVQYLHFRILKFPLILSDIMSTAWRATLQMEMAWNGHILSVWSTIQANYEQTIPAVTGTATAMVYTFFFVLGYNSPSPCNPDANYWIARCKTNARIVSHIKNVNANSQTPSKTKHDAFLRRHKLSSCPPRQGRQISKPVTTGFVQVWFPSFGPPTSRPKWSWGFDLGDQPAVFTRGYYGIWLRLTKYGEFWDNGNMKLWKIIGW